MKDKAGVLSVVRFDLCRYVPVCLVHPFSFILSQVSHLPKILNVWKGGLLHDQAEITAILYISRSWRLTTDYFKSYQNQHQPQWYVPLSMHPAHAPPPPHTHIHTHTHTHAHTHTHTHKHARTLHIHTHTLFSRNKFFYSQTCTHCICTHIRTHIHIYKFKHAHTQTHPSWICTVYIYIFTNHIYQYLVWNYRENKLSNALTSSPSNGIYNYALKPYEYGDNFLPISPQMYPFSTYMYPFGYIPAPPT